MENPETLEDFYKRKFNWIPESLKHDLGHFNLFNLEPYLEGKLKAVSFLRKNLKPNFGK
jgi:AraC family transcriptional regulator, transcriptional activator of pobA